MIIYIVFLESIFSEINMYRKLQGLQKSYNFNNIMKLIKHKNNNKWYYVLFWKENVCWSATFAKYKFSYEFFPFIVEMEYFNFVKYIRILSKLFI